MTYKRLTWPIIGILLLFALSLPVACSDSKNGAENATARGEAARDKPFVASVLREPFHKSSCRWAKKINTENLAGYDERDQAIADGHRPCKVCRPCDQGVSGRTIRRPGNSRGDVRRASRQRIGTRRASRERTR